jgi:hypothetical protein
MSTEIRYPQKDGLKRARELTRKLRDKKPSDELIQIINENNRLIDEEDRRDREEADELDRAALPKPRQPEL